MIIELLLLISIILNILLLLQQEYSFPYASSAAEPVENTASEDSFCKLKTSFDCAGQALTKQRQILKS